MTETSSTNGVTPITLLPLFVSNEIGTWQSISFTLKYNIPPMAFSFSNRIKTSQEDEAGRQFYSDAQMSVEAPVTP